MLMSDAFEESGLAVPRSIAGDSSLIGDCGMIASETGCRLVVSCQPDVGNASVLADRFLCRLIVMNVISNAIRASKAAGREPAVELSVRRGENERIHFRFADNGAGMERSEMERLNSGAAFTTKDEKGQHGIGFSYSREIAARLGGKLYVEGSGPGIGTTVVLELRESIPPGERLH